MIEVIYPGPYSAVVLSDGRVFVSGEPVAVDEATANALIKQGFKRAPKNKDGNK